MLVWTCKKERKRLHGEKDDGDDGARQKEEEGQGEDGWIWSEKTWKGLELGKDKVD